MIVWRIRTNVSIRLRTASCRSNHSYSERTSIGSLGSSKWCEEVGEREGDEGADEDEGDSVEQSPAINSACASSTAAMSLTFVEGCDWSTMFSVSLPNKKEISAYGQTCRWYCLNWIDGDDGCLLLRHH
jgi:hypothetical protein